MCSLKRGLVSQRTTALRLDCSRMSYSDSIHICTVTCELGALRVTESCPRVDAHQPAVVQDLRAGQVGLRRRSEEQSQLVDRESTS
jgi:hypothetical protein